MKKRRFLAEGGRINTRALLVVAGILAVVFVGGMIFVSIYNKSHTPERLAANTFVNDMVKQDATDTYGMLSKRMLKSYSKDQWKAIVGISFVNYKGKPKFVSETPVADPTPTYGKTANPQRLVYTFQGKYGAYRMYVIMVYENNAWKVDEFNNAS